MGQDWSNLEQQDEESRQSSRSLLQQQPKPGASEELKQEMEEIAANLEERARLITGTTENW